MRSYGKLNFFVLSVVIATFLLAGVFFVATIGPLYTANATTTSNEKTAVSTDVDVIIIDNDGYKKDRRGPVKFTHLNHARDYKIICWDCHHDIKDEKNSWKPWENTQKCNECHDPVKELQSSMKLQKAFHMNCKTCHKTLSEQEKNTGPFKKCYGCHEKTK